MPRIDPLPLSQIDPSLNEVIIGLANFFNRLNGALQIGLEPGVQPLLIDEIVGEDSPRTDNG